MNGNAIPRLSAFIKIDCLRNGAKLVAARGQSDSLFRAAGVNIGIRMQVERRSVARTTIAKNALLFFDAQRGVFTCRVQDITNSGAGIELHSLNLLPLNFELTFDKFHTVRECRVIWRHGDFVGVAFQN